MFKQLTKNEFWKELNNLETILIDVRTEKERKMFWQIQENQLNMDFYNPNIAKDILSLDKSKKYLIYCWHWNRSQTVVQFMQENWFSWACDLEWWINNWNR